MMKQNAKVGARAGWLLAVGSSLLLGSASAQAGLDDLFKRIPESTNGLIVVKVKDLLTSPLGTKQNWAKQQRTNYEEGVTSIPPNTRSVLMATEFDPTSKKSNWEVYLAEVEQSPSLETLARAEGGKTDSVAGADVVWSPRDVLFTKFNDNVVGAMVPANRQQMGRWLRFAQRNDSSKLSPYLTSAAAIADDEGQIVMALELQDLLAAPGIRAALTRSKALAGTDADIDAMVKVMMTLKGVTFAVRVTDKIQGKMRIDFGESTEVFAKVAKPLILEVIANQGAEIEDMDSWSAKVDGSAITLFGSLSPKGMRELLSPFKLPTSSLGRSADVPSESTRLQDSMAEASQRYYRAVNKLLDDLREKKGKTQGQTAFWHDQYAQKIDRLPLLNVDEELLKAGAEIAERLRQIAMDMRGAGIAIGTQTAGMSGASYNTSNWGYTGYTSGNPDIARIKAAERGKGWTSKAENWNQIDVIVGSVRKDMTKKYQVEF